ncbi:YceI family protein [Kangiella sp. HD9-110m-PIT-SAG06]|nr:YceI family protein [Kangiella sp. HD9-110m-PIT-SAG06]
MLRHSLLKPFVAVAFIALAACSSDEQTQEKAQTNWSVVKSQSEIKFSSTKNGDIKEEHSFANFEGDISSHGEVIVTIDLSSVDTNIEIRDERLQKHVFNTEQTPNAVINADIDPELLTTKKETTTSVNGTLTLVGKTSEFQANLVVAPSKNNLVVKTQQPIMLSVKDLGIKQGIDKLQEIAGLQSISDEVPVTLSLTIKPKK